MITKKQFILKLREILKKSLPGTAAESAVKEIEIQKLKGIKDSAPLPEKIIDDNLIVLFSRISFIKGGSAPEDFIAEFNSWRYSR